MKRFLSIMLCMVLIAGLVAVSAEAKKKTKTKKNKTKTETTYNEKTAKNNIKVTYTKTNTGILAVYKNKNNYAVSLKGTLKYVDAAGGTLLEDSVENLCLGKKKTMAYFYKAPVDENSNYMEYYEYSGSFTVADTSKKDYTDKITITTDIQPTMCKCVAMNTATKDLTSIFTTFVFYDAAGNILAAYNQHVNCTSASSALDFSVEYPGLSQPASVKVYKNWAY